VKSRINDSRAGGAGWLDQHQSSGVELCGHPRRDAVAGDIPRVRQRVGGPEPLQRGDDGRQASMEGLLDGGGVIHADEARARIGNHFGVLIHPGDRHPVGRSIGERECLVHTAHGIGERPAAGYDDEPL
jgi:hypothetical protein